MDLERFLSPSLDSEDGATEKRQLGGVRHRETEGNIEHTPGSFALPEARLGWAKVKSWHPSLPPQHFSSPWSQKYREKREPRRERGAFRGEVC